MNKSALLATLMAPVAIGGEFDPVNVAHSGAFYLDDPPEQTFNLFTAPGEMLWVPGWDPVILSGNGTEKGTVFITSHGGEDTIWVVVDFDSTEFHARYARVSPAVRAGTVDVRVHSNEHGGSTVEVSYDLTALSESGNENLTAFDAESFSGMLKEWENLILAANIDYQAAFPN